MGDAWVGPWNVAVRVPPCGGTVKSCTRAPPSDQLAKLKICPFCSKLAGTLSVVR